jgi:glutamine synthetase
MPGIPPLMCPEARKKGSEARDEILSKVKRENVRFVQFAFMDILGIPKMVSVPSKRLEGVIDEGVAFDGSSVMGYATIDESDRRAIPDLSTFVVLPWEDGQRKTGRFICDIYDTSGKRFEGDPRWALERVLDDAKSRGLRCNVGPEYEFFLLETDESGAARLVPNDRGGYFDMMAMDSGELVRKDTVNFLIESGADVEATHHEVSSGQHEIDLRYGDALACADRVFLLKDAIKTAARAHGLHATFMPKPFMGRNGSGMHVHQSLADGSGANLFHDPSGKFELSDVALSYMAGLLAHSKETCAILASRVNSYKRLVPGYEAPVYICWANKNRSSLVRVPAGRGKSTRMEMRNPDPAGNPYLQFAVMLAAGLKGVEKKMTPPEPVEKDIFHISPKEREKMGVDNLPESLGHALSCMQDSKLVLDVLGRHLFDHFITVKAKEWGEYRSQVTPWETDRMINI